MSEAINQTGVKGQLARLRSILEASDALPEITSEVEFKRDLVEGVEFELLSSLAAQIAKVYQYSDLYDSIRPVCQMEVERPTKGLFRKTKKIRESFPVKFLYIFYEPKFNRLHTGIGIREDGTLVSITGKVQNKPLSKEDVRIMKHTSKRPDHYKEIYGPSQAYLKSGLDWRYKSKTEELTLETLEEWEISLEKLLEVTQKSLKQAVQKLDETNSQVSKRAENVGLRIG